MKTVLSELFLFSSIPWFYILLVFRSFGLGVARAVWVHRHPPVTGSLLVSSHSPRFQPWEKQALRGWENVIWKAWWVEDDSDALGLGADKTQHDTQVLNECVVVVIAVLTATDCTFTLYLMIVYVLLFSPLSILWYRYYYFIPLYQWGNWTMKS